MAEPERARRWTGLHQDSGDPFLFAPRVKAMYKSIDIDHESKILVYSDALTIERCLAIKKQCDELGFSKGGFLSLVFGCRSHWFSVTFGIGTFLTNDFRSLSNGDKSKPLNIVIKLSSVNGLPCIKLSDDVTKVRINVLRLRLTFLTELKHELLDIGYVHPFIRLLGIR